MAKKVEHMAAINSKWPPIEWLWTQYRENAAWFSGNEELLKTYTHGFWKDGGLHKVHLPIASDIATLSSGLLFSGSPTIKSDDPRTDERLQEILTNTGIYQILLTAAKLQSVYGGVFLKLNWNVDILPHPIVTVIPADQGLAEYKHGVLTGVQFWAEIKYDEYTGDVWRFAEHYTNDGGITASLYRGTRENLGNQVPLSSIEETEDVAESITSGVNMLLATYIPNKMPNQDMPHSMYGNSDYQGILGMFSALDEVYSSLVRDVRLGKTRIIVPLEFLRRKQTLIETANSSEASRWVFDSNDETFVTLDINPQDNGAGITTVQPEVRSAPLLEIANDLIRRIYIMAGYSPQSAGIDITGMAESGTALNVRERRSLQTTEAKKTYWWHALNNIIKALIALDKAVFFTNIKPESNITVSFADNSQPDMQTVASTVQMLSSSGAISTEEKVVLLHPDWDEDKQAIEVLRIKQSWNELLAGQGAAAVNPWELRKYLFDEDEAQAKANLPDAETLVQDISPDSGEV